MKPIKFKEANKNLLKPQNMIDEECSSLWVYTDGRECISCWKMSFKQRLSALIHGKVWLSILSGGTQPPVWLDCCDTVYYAGIDTPIKFTVIGFSKGRMYDCSVADYEEIVEDNELNVDEWYVHLDSFCGLKQMSPLSSFGKRLFVGDDAEKEAEKALAERQDKNEKP